MGMIVWLAILVLTVAGAGLPFSIEQGKPKFSLRFLFIATAYIALGCAVVLSESEFWSLLLWPTSFGSVSTAVLAVTYRRGKRRAFWVGFLVFGLGYLIVLLLIGLWPFTGGEETAALVLHIPIALIGRIWGDTFKARWTSRKAIHANKRASRVGWACETRVS